MMAENCGVSMKRQRLMIKAGREFKSLIRLRGGRFMVKKRKISSVPYDVPVSIVSDYYSEAEIENFIKTVRYEGNPRHKKARGDFILQAGIRPSPKKTLCDISGIFKSGVALSLLKEGIRHGLVSPPDSRTYELRWPKCIWAMKDGLVLEARHTGNGIYHGYPELDSNALNTIIRSKWNDHARAKTI